MIQISVGIARTENKILMINRGEKQEKLDIEMIGEEKKIKNQATRKIKWAVDEKRRKLSELKTAQWRAWRRQPLLRTARENHTLSFYELHKQN